MCTYQNVEIYGTPMLVGMDRALNNFSGLLTGLRSIMFLVMEGTSSREARNHVFLEYFRVYFELSFPHARDEVFIETNVPAVRVSWE